eukprot:TRINITY_DN99766_c0_g1_i1.p1 TRINITY_DN99766_c0_g1~~TRINITY_DN99766_c0_g1_i1.p1  ORF type:complete len:590 (+),score=105.93 TRINITY_DN99766_c0_g1_i1:101-1771(+)
MATASTDFPPGLLRLGLSHASLTGVAQAAREAGPSEALSWLSKRGELRFDSAQLSALEPLDSAWQSARDYAKEFPKWQERHGLWEAECARLRAEHRELVESRKRSKCAGDQDAEAGSTDQKAVEDEPLVLPAAPQRPELRSRGCYIWGKVGRGKTLLMDLFALSLNPAGDLDRQLNGVEVQRVHFHGFMHNIHRRLHELRRDGARDGLARAVQEATSGHPSVLCFDEFQITTVADASLLTPLIGELFTRDSIVVITSNRPPEQLYKGGLNRDFHMGAFDSLLRSQLDVHHLDAPVDYRYEAAASSDSSQLASDFMVAPVAEELDSIFETATAGSLAHAQKLPVAWGRTLHCQKVSGGTAQFTFEELCGAPLSAEDYLTLIQKGGIHTFMVSEVPRFGLKLHNEARRFTNLVDALYDHQCRLVCTAEAPIDDLLAGMDRLCTAEMQTEQPAMGIAGSEKSLRQHRHGDVTFESSELSPCRPDTFATAEADSEAGTSCFRLGAGSDSSDTQDGVAGVMAAAVDSLRESGFAARRCTSRLREMSTPTYRSGHAARWGLA